MPSLFLSQRRDLLIYQARWLASIGITEQGGENMGTMVEFFQKSTDDRAVGEPWCSEFVWNCIRYVDGLCAHAFRDDRVTGLYPSAHVLTMWRRSHPFQASIPRPGDLAIWQHHKDGQPTEAGHVGIVTEVLHDERKMRTVEGNTSAGEGVVREGDGVFERERDIAGTGSMRCIGFLQVWA